MVATGPLLIEGGQQLCNRVLTDRFLDRIRSELTEASAPREPMTSTRES